MCLDILIRDDDVNYFTTPEEIRCAYSEFINNLGGVVNFAVVPNIKPSVTGCVPSNYWSVKKSFPLDENKEIVQLLFEGLHQGFYGIMMHGINHEYIFKRGRALPEFRHLTYEYDELLNEKNYLEKLFGVNIDAFVPPGNYLSAESYQKITKLFPYLFNVPSLVKSSRNFSIKNIWWWLKRILFHFCNKRIPHRIRNGGYDISSIDITPNTDFFCLHEELKGYIKSNNKYLLVLATHYWEMGGFDNNCSAMNKKFNEFAADLKRSGVRFININDLSQESILNEKYSNVCLF